VGVRSRLEPGRLPKRAVWSRSVEIMKMDRQDPAQVAFVDDQNLVKQCARQRSNHPFADRVRPLRPPGQKAHLFQSKRRTDSGGKSAAVPEVKAHPSGGCGVAGSAGVVSDSLART
jgi:hypothetical protein